MVRRVGGKLPSGVSSLMPFVSSRIAPGARPLARDLERAQAFGQKNLRGKFRCVLIGLAAFAAAFAIAGPALAAAPCPSIRMKRRAPGSPPWARRRRRAPTAISKAATSSSSSAPLLSIVIAGAADARLGAQGVRNWLEKTVKFYFLVALGMALVLHRSSRTVLTFPFSYYVGFVREHEFGLSTQTFREWFSEYLIGLGIGLVIGSICHRHALSDHPRRARSTWWIWGTVVDRRVRAPCCSIAYPGLHRADLQHLHADGSKARSETDILAHGAGQRRAGRRRHGV